MRTTIRRSPALLLLALGLLALPFATGCRSGTTPSGVKYTFVWGGAEAVYDHSLDEVYSTAAAAMTQFELTLGERSKDAFDGQIVAYDRGNLDHVVNMKRLAPGRTRVWIAVNPPWGVEDRSLAILARMDRMLNEPN